MKNETIEFLNNKIKEEELKAKQSEAVLNKIWTGHMEHGVDQEQAKHWANEVANSLIRIHEAKQLIELIEKGVK